MCIPYALNHSIITVHTYIGYLAPLLADAGCNVLMMQRFIILRELADVLDNGDFKDRPVMTELQDFYKSCTAAEQSESFDYEPFREVYRMIGEGKHGDVGSQCVSNTTNFQELST